ncbi:MAG: hypothetical protein CW716_09415 [Candidatus Bathyarchaeum sp.]|nr:MAG: hypothetical protein CW716_09415 [Candidatus Bathyarchaeum sp.]
MIGTIASISIFSSPENPFPFVPFSKSVRFYLKAFLRVKSSSLFKPPIFKCFEELKTASPVTSSFSVIVLFVITRAEIVCRNRNLCNHDSFLLGRALLFPVFHPRKQRAGFKLFV